MQVGAEISKRFATNVLGTLAAFLGTLFFTRELGFSGIGTYAVFLSIEMIAANLFGFGLYPVVIKRVSEGTDQAKHFTSGLLLLLGGVILVTIASVLLRTPINDVTGEAVALYVPLGVLSWGLFNLSTSYLEGRQRVALAGALQNGRYAIIVPIQAFFVIDGHGVPGLVWGLIIGQFVTFLVAYGGYARVKPALPSRSLFTSFLAFSKYAYVQSFANQAFKHADYVILGAFVGPGPTGVYKNAFTITESSMLFSSALSNVVLPQFSALAESGDTAEIRRLLRSVFSYAGLFAVPIIGGGAIIGNDLMLTLYAEQAGETTLPVLGTLGLANALIPLLALANLFNGYREGLEKYFLGTGRPRVYATSGVLLLSMYGILVLPMASAFGAMGVAAATVLAFASSVGAMILFLEDAVPRPAILDVGTEIVAMGVMTGLVHALVQELNGAHGALRLGVVLVLGALVYFVVLLGLSERMRIDAVAISRDLFDQYL